VGSSVHDEIDDGRIPAMTCSDSRPPTASVTFEVSYPMKPREAAVHSATPMTFATSLPGFELDAVAVVNQTIAVARVVRTKFFRG